MSTQTTTPYQTPDRWQVTAEARQEIRRQIGQMNVLSISGGRVTAIKDGIELPVSNGFRVRVHLTPSDEYVVERVFVRGKKEFQHGQIDAFTDTVSEAAYYASCFRSYDAETWPRKVV